MKHFSMQGSVQWLPVYMAVLQLNRAAGGGGGL